MTNEDGGASRIVIPSAFDVRASSFTRRKLLRLLPACALAACGPEPEDKRPKFPAVPWRITSTSQFTADLVKQIGGEAVQSECIVPLGVNPFTYTPSALDLSKFRKGDMAMIHGLGLEARWPEDFAELEKSKVKVITVTSGIPEPSIIRPSGPAGPAHPCVWMDPSLAVLMIETITAALKEAMPKLADYFQPRAYKMRLELEAGHAAQKTKMAALKDTDRFLLTSHDSMPYFARAYELQARALTAIDGKIPETLPEALTEWIRSHGVRTLFREAFTDPIPLRALLRGVGVNPDFPMHSLALPAAGKKELVGFKEYDVTTAVNAILHALDLVQYTLSTDG